MILFRLLSQLISLLAGLLTRHSLADLDRYRALYTSWDDAALRAELRRLGVGAAVPPASAAARNDHRFQWMNRTRDSAALQALAIASCIFDRHPCDLPAGAVLYDEQKAAALALIDHVNVQMDTGEGKTYAVALAATALLAQHPQVVVVTANDYLAHRDQQRVARYFTAAGVETVCAVPGADFRGVAYTTLGDLCREYLHRAYRKASAGEVEYPQEAAVLIDEIDSVLLDNVPAHSLNRALPTDETIWDEVFALAEAWGELEYTYDRVTDVVSVKADGWNRVAELSGRTGQPVSFLIELVASALWARHATIGEQYAIDDDQVLLINSVTGIPYTASGSRTAAIEHLVLGRRPTVSLVLATIDGLTLLRRHPHVVGLSGTVAEDTLYYLQQLATLTTVIPPRFPRHPGLAGSVLSRSREDTYRYLEKRIRDVAPRPVIIGTWSSGEAQRIAAHLRADGVVDDAHLGVLTTFDSTADASVIAHAGSLGRVTVLSQGGSRGVDVRSQHRPLLIVLGLAIEPRLDKQFLGRVGRHGEAFEAQVVVDPSSPLWTGNFMLHTGLLSEPIPFDRWVTRRLHAAQRRAGLYTAQRRHQASVVDAAIGDMEAAMAARFRELRRIQQEAATTAEAAEGLATWVEGGAGHADHPADPGSIAQVREALRRRLASDAEVAEFEAVVAAAVGGASQPDRPYTMKALRTPEDARELVALTSWLRTSRDTPMDAAARELFQRQAALAADQRLPIVSHPRWRDPNDVAFESLIAANAAQLAHVSNRLAALAVSSSSDTYYRRAAFVVRNQQDSTALTLTNDLVSSLRIVDHPGQLDDLFYAADHQVFSPSSAQRSTAPEVPPPDAGTPFGDAVPPQLDRSAAEAAVDRFLEERDKARGGLPMPPAYARVLLLEALRPVIDTGARVDSAGLTRHVELIIDSAAGRGRRGRALRDHRTLIREFIADLNGRGVLSVELERRSVAATTARRVKRFLQTIPKVGLLAIAGYLAVLGLGLLIVGHPVRTTGFLGPLGDALGFGSGAATHPALVILACLIGLRTGLRGAGLREPEAVLGPLSPLLAVALTLALYADGWSSLWRPVGIALLLMFWTAALGTAQRFVLTMVGVDATLVVGAASVLVLLIRAATDGTAGQHSAVLIGMLAGLVGPGLPVSVGSAEYSLGSVRRGDERARIRISIDGALTSAVVAFVVTAVTVGLHGTPAFAVFGTTQLVVVAVLSGIRLRPSRIRGLLATLRIGTPLGEARFQRYLHRAAWRSTAVAAVVLAAACAEARQAGMDSTWSLLLDQWSGLVLVSGTLAAIGVFSVAGTPSPTMRSSPDEQSTWAAFKERLRTWRRLRFARWIEVGLAAVLLSRPLFQIMKLVKLTAAAGAAWHAILRL